MAVSLLLTFFTLFLFLLLILSHEFGHFIMAKKFNVKVNEFSVGMGPILFSKRKGETLYCLRLLPFGGYCSMEGENFSEDFSSRSLVNLPKLKQVLVIIAGAFSNLIVALFFIFINLSQQSSFSSNVIANFYENSVTKEQGLKINDKIISINSYKINNFTDLSFSLAINNPEKLDIVVERNNKKIILKDLRLKTQEDPSKKKIFLVRDFFLKPVEKNFFSLITNSFGEMISKIRITLKSVSLLITGKLDISNVSGPIGIVNNVKEIASYSLKTSFWHAANNVILMMAIVSINLGILNLLPIPALDGSRILFFLIECIIGKKIGPKIQENVNKIAFIALIIFTLFVTFKDIQKIIT